MDSQRPYQINSKRKTSIYVDEDDFAKITEIAQSIDVSPAWVIRQIIHRNVDNFALKA